MQIYVRENSTLTLPCGSYHVFGSGWSSIRLTLAGPAERGPSRDGGHNGFVGARICNVTLPPGSSAHVQEWHDPGGDSDRLYIADTARWREQRQKHLTELFARRATAARYRAHEERRKTAIRERLAVALRGGDARLARAIASIWAVEVGGRWKTERPGDDPYAGLISPRPSG